MTRAQYNSIVEARVWSLRFLAETDRIEVSSDPVRVARASAQLQACLEKVNQALKGER